MFYNAANERITVESGGSLEFTSSNTEVATINSATGSARGVAGGSVTITARYLRNGQLVREDATTLIVNPVGSSTNGSATISTNGGNTRTLRVGQTLLFQLIVLDVNGAQVVAGLTPSRPTSSNEGVVTIGPSTISGGFFYNMTAAANAPVGTVITIRYNVPGAGGEIRMTIIP